MKNEDLTGGLFDGRGSPQPLGVSARAHLAGRCEHDEQAGVIYWAKGSARLQTDALLRELLEERIYAHPNGAFLFRQDAQEQGTLGGRWTRKRYAPKQAIKLKAEGMRAGVPDLFVPWPARDGDGRITCPGLYIEMKRPGVTASSVSPEQRVFIAFLRAAGYRVEVCYCWQQAARLIVAYLGLEKYIPIPSY